MINVQGKSAFTVHKYTRGGREYARGSPLAFTHLQVDFLSVFTHPQFEDLLITNALKDC